jgi:hypothetical protein
MSLEDRYYVIKKSDFDSTFNPGVRHERELQLKSIMARIEIHRRGEGKLPIEAVVIESDWPEYEPTVKALESRIEKETETDILKNIFGDYKPFPFLYIVRVYAKGVYLVTSDAHSASRLKDYSGYMYRALYSREGDYDPLVVRKTGWDTSFTEVIQIRPAEIIEFFREFKSEHRTKDRLADFIDRKLPTGIDYE